jgi:hypothetical protein
LRGGEFDYVEIASDFGMRIVYSRGRWIVMGVIAMAIETGLTLWLVVLWVATRHPTAVALGLFCASLDAIVIWIFVWSMTRPDERA